MRQFVDRMITLPLGCRIAAINRLLPIESQIPTRDGAIIKVISVSLPICVHHIAEKHIKRRHCTLEFGKRICTSHKVPFAKPSITLEFRHPDRKFLTVAYGEYRTVMCSNHLEVTLIYSSRGLYQYRLGMFRRHPITFTVSIC